MYLYHVYGREKKLFRGGIYLYRPLEKSLTARVVDGIKRPCTATVVVKHDILYLPIYCYKTTVSVSG